MNVYAWKKIQDKWSVYYLEEVLRQQMKFLTLK